jgi:hypothetical protein
MPRARLGDSDKARRGAGPDVDKRFDVILKRFAFILNHFDRRTRLFPKLCLGDQSDALTQIERETL